MSSNNIDVYLHLLVKDVDIYNSFKKEMFPLHLTLMWTINDFMKLGTLSRWNTYIGISCLLCNFGCTYCCLPHNEKWCFMVHCCFIDRGNQFRLNKARFNGQQDRGSPPITLFGHQFVEQVNGIKDDFSKATQGDTQQWENNNIFFELI